MTAPTDDQDAEQAELRAEVERLQQGLWDTWAALGHDIDGDTGPGALIAGTGNDGFVKMVIEDTKKVMAENDADWTHEFERAEAAEAKVARVEALADKWIGVGVLRSMSATHTAQLGRELRAALGGCDQ